MAKLQSAINLLIVWTTVLCIVVQSFGRGPSAVLCFGGYPGSISAGCGVFVPQNNPLEVDTCCDRREACASPSDDRHGSTDCSLCIVVDADQRLGDAPQSCDFKPCFVGFVPDFVTSAGIVVTQSQPWALGNHVPGPRCHGFAARSLVRLI